MDASTVGTATRWWAAWRRAADARIHRSRARTRSWNHEGKEHDFNKERADCRLLLARGHPWGLTAQEGLARPFRQHTSRGGNPLTRKYIFDAQEQINANPVHY